MSEWAAAAVMALALCVSLLAGMYYGGDWLPEQGYMPLHQGFFTGVGS